MMRCGVEMFDSDEIEPLFLENKNQLRFGGCELKFGNRKLKSVRNGLWFVINQLLFLGSLAGRYANDPDKS